VDRQDLLRVSEITGVELDDDEIREMLSTERNRGNGKVDYEDFKYFME
jgi:Ca2+-binding EF-hand superfamily protein